VGQLVAASYRELNMNLAVLKKSRRRLKEGDIFVMLPPDGLYLFGRVIDMDARVFTDIGWNLIYIYRARSEEKTNIPDLLRGQLLLRPLITNRLAWSRGYFEHVEHRPLAALDRLPHHCFRNSYGRYFDERGNQLPGPIEPVGMWGLDSYRTIDDAISRALGIPLAPD